MISYMNRRDISERQSTAALTVLLYGVMSDASQAPYGHDGSQRTAEVGL